MQSELRIEKWRGKRREDLTARSDRYRSLWWIDQSISYCLRRLVRASGAHGNSWRQTEFVRGSPAELAHDFC
jgi:hypothetical protein